jgi:DNA-binding transcriptional LysR family regulator
MEGTVLELRHLVTFLAIVEKGGFKRAADSLGYAQSSVTTHIKELESELGQPLFDRLGRNVILTQSGKELLPYAQQMIALYGQLKERMNSKDAPAGKLSIGASESLTIYRLPRVIQAYRKKYPAVSLSLKPEEYQNIDDLLKEGQMDIALVVQPHDWSPSDLYIEKLKEEKMVFIEPIDSHPYNKTILYTDKDCSYRTIFDRYLSSNHIEVNESLDFWSTEAIKQCVMSGLGISLLPYFEVKEELEQKKLKGTWVEKAYGRVCSFAAIHKKKWRSPAMEAFFTVLKEDLPRWE